MWLCKNYQFWPPLKMAIFPTTQRGKMLRHTLKARDQITSFINSWLANAIPNKVEENSNNLIIIILNPQNYNRKLAEVIILMERAYLAS